jgi:hypothetical protein
LKTQRYKAGQHHPLETYKTEKENVCCSFENEKGFDISAGEIINCW